VKLSSALFEHLHKLTQQLKYLQGVSSNVDDTAMERESSVVEKACCWTHSISVQ
jgi:hypothetical protein